VNFEFDSGCPRLPVIDFEPKISVESVNLCEKIPNVNSNFFDFKRIESLFRSSTSLRLIKKMAINIPVNANK